MKTLQIRTAMVLIMAVAVLFAAGVVRPAAAQDNPSPPNVLAEDSRITVSWSPVSGADAYYVAWKRTDGQHYDWNEYHMESSGMIMHGRTIHGLVNGVEYAFYVAPITVDKSGTWRHLWVRHPVVTSTPNGPILPAPMLTAMPGDDPGSVNLSWTATPNVKKYTYEYKLATQDWELSVERPGQRPSALRVDVKGTTATVRNLDPGKRYIFRINTTAFVGNSDWEVRKSDWAEAEVWSKTVKPAIHSVTTTSQQVTLGWHAVPGATGYAYQYRAGQSGNWSGEVNVAAGSLAAIVRRLNDGTLYDFRLRATGPATDPNNPSWSDLVQATPASPNDFPSVPVQADVTPGTTAALLVWQSGAQGACPATSYHVSITDKATKAVVVESPPIAAQENQSHYRWYVEGLTAGKAYLADISSYGAQCNANSEETAHLSFDMDGENNPSGFEGLEVDPEGIKRPAPIRNLKVKKARGQSVVLTWDKPHNKEGQRCPLEDEVEYRWHLENRNTGDITEDVFHSAADPVELTLARMERRNTQYRISIKAYSPRCDRASKAKDIDWVQKGK